MITDPFIVGDLNEVTGSLKDHSRVGEYVNYAGRNYRVVETSSSGTKLILDGYYDSNNDGVIETSDKTIETGNALFVFINEETFINWISNNNEADKSKLISTTWYREFYFDYGDDYKESLESTSRPYVGEIGVIRMGEMLSGQSETILSKNHATSSSSSNAQTYWTSNGLWYINLFGSSFQANVYNIVRPVLMISPDVQITSGNGTFNEPYRI